MERLPLGINEFEANDSSQHSRALGSMELEPMDSNRQVPYCANKFMARSEQAKVLQVMMQSDKLNQSRLKSSPEKTLPTKTIPTHISNSQADEYSQQHKRTSNNKSPQKPSIPIVTSNTTTSSNNMNSSLPKQQLNNNYDEMTSSTDKLNTSDDQYVTATDSSFESPSISSAQTITLKQTRSTHKQNHSHLVVSEEEETRMVNSREASNQNQCELLRGKRQRASISSCSSSDSYVSYGSGYASGSSHSTDLEHKLKAEVIIKQVATCMRLSDQIDSKETDIRQSKKVDTKLTLDNHSHELDKVADVSLTNQRSFANEETETAPSMNKSSSPIANLHNINSITGITPDNSTNKFLSEKNNATNFRTVQSSFNKLNTSTISNSTEYSPQKVSSYLSRVQEKADLDGTTPSKQSLNSSIDTSTRKDTLSNAKQEQFHQTLTQFEQLLSRGVRRPLLINDLDFTDLHDDDDCDLLNGSVSNNNNNSKTKYPSQSNESPTNNIKRSSQDHPDGAPPNAPPPMPPPPMSPWFNTFSGGIHSNITTSSDIHCPDANDSDLNLSSSSRASARVPQSSTPSSKDDLSHVGFQPNKYAIPPPSTGLRAASSMSSLFFGKNSNKRKKTMKLFWKEVRDDSSLMSKLTRKKTIWDELKPVQIDTLLLEQLFESKAKDINMSKSPNGLDTSAHRKTKISVLDSKRSNAINIGMTKLPPVRTIKTAILEMDSSIINREGIEKILTTMMPTEEEKSRIIEAQLANPDTPLGTAEQFLLNLASISALEARLKLWAFQLDYAQIEKEVAEPLMDLKQAIEEIERSETFRNILGTLLAIGNFLNSTSAKGFQIDYLEKVPEVKDTLHKHSLLHHLCLFIQEKYDPELEHDLYSEFSSVNRASKVDYAEVAKSLKKMQQDCKASWDYLKIVAKHDGLANLMNACTSSSGGASSSSNGSSTNSSANSGGGVGGTANEEALRVSPIKTSGKLNNLSKLSMITTVVSSDVSSAVGSGNSTTTSDQQVAGGGGVGTKQLKTKVSDFLTDCAERIMVLVVIHRRVMNRFQKLLVYLGCPSHQIKQTQPQQILKVINEFALEYRTKRERIREMLAKKRTPCQHNLSGSRWQLNRTRWAGSQQCLDTINRTEYPAQLHNHYENRASSPSGSSQISNYSDCQQFDQQSRQPSVARVPHYQHTNNNSSSSILERVNYGASQLHNNRRPNSMSVSMYDLQNQFQQQQTHDHHGNMASSQNATENVCKPHNSGKGEDNRSEQRQKDEQLRRLLGAGKSLDESCNELSRMSHWSSPMMRVTRHPPAFNGQSSNKLKASGIDISAQDSQSGSECHDDVTSHSPRHKYLQHSNGHNTKGAKQQKQEDDGDEEILQSLARITIAKSGHHHPLSSGGTRLGSSCFQSS